MSQFVAREAFGCALLGALALAACTSITGGSSLASNTVSTFSPTTSVEVDSSTLFARLGCGQAPNVPYKYIVTVTPPPPALPAFISVNDCFTNAVFENLPQGETNVTMTVAVFDEPHFDAPHPYDIRNPALSDQAAILADAQWTTTCAANQTEGLAVLAVCDPLH